MKKMKIERGDEMMTAKTVNKIVGQNLKNLRRQHGMSQTELGRRMGITYQQVQKYEKGVSSLSAYRLVQLAKIFEVGIERELFAGINM